MAVSVFDLFKIGNELRRGRCRWFFLNLNEILLVYN
ncbi:MAG: hypothetical protein ACI95C_000976, partial [Pseudohongiellaceae bacterium]